jgi:hypothetical protein
VGPDVAQGGVHLRPRVCAWDILKIFYLISQIFGVIYFNYDLIMSSEVPLIIVNVFF